eukprot:13140846-Ditylum_brightwellii.AAC.1
MAQTKHTSRTWDGPVMVDGRQQCNQKSSTSVEIFDCCVHFYTNQWENPWPASFPPLMTQSLNNSKECSGEDNGGNNGASKEDDEEVKENMKGGGNYDVLVRLANKSVP